MNSDPNPDRMPRTPAGSEPEPEATSYQPLYDTLNRAASSGPGWRRWLTPAADTVQSWWQRSSGFLSGTALLRQRRVVTIATAGALTVVLSTIGVVATVQNGGLLAAFNRGERSQPPAAPGEVALSPPATPTERPSAERPSASGSGVTTREASETPDATALEVSASPEPRATPTPPQDGGQPCPTPLSVVADPDIADLVSELASTLDDGRGAAAVASDAEHVNCPQVTVRARESAEVLAQLTDEGSAPDVWIPASSLWLRTASVEPAFPDQRSSIARSPVVMAFPAPVHDKIKGPNTWPVWVMVYNVVTEGRIETMSMPDTDTTTVGALALVGLHDAMLAYGSDNADAAAMLTVNLRNHLATTSADVDALLAELGRMTDGTGAENGVGIFPATEQQVLAYNRGDPAVPITPMGMYDAMTEADYPMAIAEATAQNDRLADIAGRLQARLLSAEAVELFVKEDFRPPRDNEIYPDELSDTERWPLYPEPVDLPDAQEWKNLTELWNLS